VTLIPETEDDLYLVYNLVVPGDEVLAKTDRKVHSTSSTGSTTSYRVQMRLNIKVTKVRSRYMLDTACSASASLLDLLLSSETSQRKRKLHRAVVELCTAGSKRCSTVHNNVLTIQTAFSAAASSETNGDQSEARAVMSITGQVTEANDYVRIGAFHTLELERE